MKPEWMLTDGELMVANSLEPDDVDSTTLFWDRQIANAQAKKLLEWIARVYGQNVLRWDTDNFSAIGSKTSSFTVGDMCRQMLKQLEDNNG